MLRARASRSGNSRLKYHRTDRGDCDQGTYLAWLPDHLPDEPTRCSTGLPVVGSHKACAARGGQVSDIGNDRNACGLRFVDCLTDQRAVGAGNSDGVALLGEAQEIAGNGFRGHVVLKVHIRLDNGMDAPRCGSDDCSDPQLVKRPVRLLHEKAKISVEFLALALRTQPAKADLFRCLHDALGGFGAHCGATTQGPICRRHTHASCLRELGDRRPFHRYPPNASSVTVLNGKLILTQRILPRMCTHRALKMMQRPPRAFA